ncbi:MAG: biotin/lipoyl-containing protein [Desulfobacterales bacterium]
MIYKIKIAEQDFEVEVEDVSEGIARVAVNGKPYEVMLENYNAIEPAPTISQAQPAQPAPTPPAPAPKAAPAPKKTAVTAGAGAIVSPIPGLVLQIKVNVGDTVSVGQSVAVVEAMKMENDIQSTVAGTVSEIRVKSGAQVGTGDVLMVVS